MRVWLCMLKTSGVFTQDDESCVNAKDRPEFYVRTRVCTTFNALFPSRPGICVVYESHKRYSDAPPDTLMVDSYSTADDNPSIEKPGGVTLGGHADVRAIYRLGDTYASGVAYERELPMYMREKMATLHMLASAHNLQYGQFVYFPNTGMKFGSGNYWIEVTWEDLMRTG